MELNLTTIIYAFLGGVLPAVIWLMFWLRQDNKKPEPKIMILIAFIGGITAVFGSLYLEKICANISINKIQIDLTKPLFDWLQNISIKEKIQLNRLLVVIFFAPIIEEMLKFIVAFFTVLKSKDNDEPIDPMIYMITVALGFAAIENMLFLIDPITKGHLTTSILTGNMRFIGATLLHTVSSSIIGIFISFNFFNKRIEKILWIIVGIICAIATHILFNFFMIGNTRESLMALEIIWIAVIIVLLTFEKIKKVKLEKIN